MKFYWKLSPYVYFNKDAVMGEVRGSIVIIDSIKTKILSTIILGIGLEDFEKIFPSTHREFFRQIEGKATPDDFFKMISI